MQHRSRGDTECDTILLCRRTSIIYVCQETKEELVNVKQNPFSLYDFLGYFTPGAIFLYGILAAIGHVQADETPITYITQMLSFEKAELYIPFVLAAYTIGHLLSFISSITVERYSIWVYGYPSKYLVGLKHEGFYFAEDKKVIRRILRTLVWISLLPIAVLDWLLGNLCGFRDLYAKRLDDFLIAAIKKKIRVLMTRHAGIRGKLSDYGTPSEFDFFRYAYHYALENAPSHVPKMQNYVALYGFLRTLTLISIVFFWWGIVWHIFIGTFSVSFALWSITLSSLVSFFLYMGFVKFYRRFSLEALMALSVTIK